MNLTSFPSDRPGDRDRGGGARNYAHRWRDGLVPSGSVGTSANFTFTAVRKQRCPAVGVDEKLSLITVFKFSYSLEADERITVDDNLLKELKFSHKISKITVRL